MLTEIFWQVIINLKWNYSEKQRRRIVEIVIQRKSPLAVRLLIDIEPAFE